MRKRWSLPHFPAFVFFLCACSTQAGIRTTPGAAAATMPAGTDPPITADICPGVQPAWVTDLDVRRVPVTAEPPARAPFRDPVFGTCQVRITDRQADLPAGNSSIGLKNEYSRVQSFNADGSRILVRGTEATWHLYDASTFLPLGELPLDVDPRWSATDPNLLFFSSETRLISHNIVTSEQTVVHEFAEDLPGYGAAMVWTRYEGSPSADGRWWGLMAEDAEWRAVAYLVYDHQTDSVTAILDLRGWSGEARAIDSVTISPLGEFFLAFMDKACANGHSGTDEDPCGLMAYGRNLRGGRGLLRIVGHADTVLDPAGREALVYQDIDTDNISILDLASGAVTPPQPIDFTHCDGCGMHFSGRAFRRPGWALVSFFDGDPASYTWMDDQVFAVELRAGGRAIRLAHHHSTVDPEQEHDYWAEPHASVDRDFSRIVFTTNWGRSGTGETEMYMILLPGPPLS
ncbi:MAG: hypothetical protein JW748_13505 [Anaerolineales bacterium]|nr:hypothetical protein [Anaerolineales bacterium]